MKNLVGYVQFPSSYDGIRFVHLFEDIRKDIGVDFCITKISKANDHMIEIELYSDKKSWQQEFFVNGIYRMF